MTQSLTAVAVPAGAAAGAPVPAIVATAVSGRLSFKEKQGDRGDGRDRDDAAHLGAARLWGAWIRHLGKTLKLAGGRLMRDTSGGGGWVGGKR